MISETETEQKRCLTIIVKAAVKARREWWKLAKRVTKLQEARQDITENDNRKCGELLGIWFSAMKVAHEIKGRFVVKRRY